MKVLKERILKEGRCYPGGILKVDKFINHQMDPNLMKDIAVEFIRRFASSNVNKILTIEASGIAPAIMMGFSTQSSRCLCKKEETQHDGEHAVDNRVFVHQTKTIQCNHKQGISERKRQGAFHRRFPRLRQCCQKASWNSLSSRARNSSEWVS